MFANRLKSQHIAKRDSGAYLTTFANVPVQVFGSTTNPNQVKNRKYIELPASIFDYDKDGGIEFISYYIEDFEPNCPPPFTNQTFTRTTQKDSSRLYFSKDETPSPKNPYFYRVGKYVYFLGIECANVKNIEIGLYTTFKPITDPDLDMDQVFEFPEETLIILKRQVLDLGRFVLMMPQERINDGSTIQSNQVPTNKITSVNEITQETPENK